jgi:hypothetical protein
MVLTRNLFGLVCTVSDLYPFLINRDSLHCFPYVSLLGLNLQPQDDEK